MTPSVTMKNIAFIINPISGTRNKHRIPKIIERTIDTTQWSYDIVFTKYKGHATELAKNYAALDFNAVVAVGGDGTMNEVASGLVHTDTALGIIPIGSGNGLARHLHIPLTLERAIEMLNHAEPITIDYAMLNEQPFFCTCGTGFDAFISSQYAASGKRGFTSYLEQIVKGVFSYQPDHYHLKGDGIDIETDAFLITIANANQWGNNGFIAPHASIQDGQLNIAIVSQFPLIAAPELALKLISKNIDKDSFVNTLITKEITITREKEDDMHFDGEPIPMGKSFTVRIVPEGLKVMVEKRY